MLGGFPCGGRVNAFPPPRHLLVAMLQELCRDCYLLAAALPCGWSHWPPHLEAAAEEWQPLVSLAGDY